MADRINPYVTRVGTDRLRVRATATATGVTGDGWVTIGKDHPDYRDWVEYLAGWEAGVAQAAADEAARAAAKPG